MDYDSEFEGIMGENDLGEQEQPTYEEIVLSMAALASALGEIGMVATIMTETEGECGNEFVLSPSTVVVLRELASLADTLVHLVEDDLVENEIIIEIDEDEEEE